MSTLVIEGPHFWSEDLVCHLFHPIPHPPPSSHLIHLLTINTWFIRLFIFAPLWVDPPTLPPIYWAAVFFPSLVVSPYDAALSLEESLFALATFSLSEQMSICNRTPMVVSPHDAALLLEDRQFTLAIFSLTSLSWQIPIFLSSCCWILDTALLSFSSLPSPLLSWWFCLYLLWPMYPNVPGWPCW